MEMGKRGQNPIPIPTNFKDYYFEQKQGGALDKVIADSLYISEWTLYRWKRKVGIKSRKGC